MLAQLGVGGTLGAPQALSAEKGESAPVLAAQDLLLERVRGARLLNLDDPKFPVPLFVGGRYGGELILSISVWDPLMPRTLDVYFDQWNLSARASLLLQYARLIADPDPGNADAEAHDSVLEGIRVKAVEDRSRIRAVVQSRHYEAEWKPFVSAYVEFRHAAEASIPQPDISPHSARDSFLAVNKIALDRGLHRLVRELHIDAVDVSNEMRRLLKQSRIEQGASGLSEEPHADLFYACVVGRSSQQAESPGELLTVHARTWHPLAAPFFLAWAEAQREKSRPEALQVMTVFHQLTDEIGVWAARNPNASSSELDHTLNRMAADRGIFDLLKRFPSEAQAGPGTVPEGTTSPVESSKREKE